MHLAITTDWLVTSGGAERVIEEMHTLWRDAPVFTTVYRKNCLPFLEKNCTTVRTSPLQKWFHVVRNHRLLVPFMPRAVESWDLRGYDMVLSSSHAVAKGCIVESSARHICYCHTPMRYAWEMEEEYLDDFRLRGPARALAKRVLKKLRRWDRTTTKRVDLFIANSRTTQERISRHYGRESIVLHPPVADRFFSCAIGPEAHRTLSSKDEKKEKQSYFLAVGRLVPYKRFDLLIAIANREKFRLKIVGEGPDGARLKRLAGETVEFCGHVRNEELPALYTNAEALLFPAHEDAGIVPLEAQACGTPVIAYGRGGVLDTVKEKETGLFFLEQTIDSVLSALQEFRNTSFNPSLIRGHAQQFSSGKFRERLLQIVQSHSLLPRIPLNPSSH